MTKFYSFLLVWLMFFSSGATAQDREISGPVFMDSAAAVSATSISKSKIIRPSKKFKMVNPRNRGINKIVPGKGMPKTEDPARQQKMGSIPGKVPILSFDAAETSWNPSDPTGAAGPEHYVNAWNSAFSIWDKNGNELVEPASLSSIGGEFAGENDGDPIVMYDEFADRFVIMQFFLDPNPNPSLPALPPFGLLIAVSTGSDPVNSGWYTYRFTLPSLPDYPKISVWSDGYYITTNKDSRTAESSEVVYVVERDRMLSGQSTQILGFPLPGINTSGFYSPAGFHAVGGRLPPPGNSPILYLQDDAWAGVSEDHLKIWNINVNWGSLGSSTIQEAQELGTDDGVTPFISTFDGGDFTNLSQPGEEGDFPDLDALQGAIMHMTSYRRFPTHNSVVLNFVVDVDASAAEHAGIRWYELRQDPNGGPWRIHQEGTYAPTGSDRWCGSIGIDRLGNIGLGFTIMDDDPNSPIFPSLRYTGRYAGDPLGVMTVEEVSIMEGVSNSPDRFGRYGDYAHLTVDPVDGVTFWHNGEYFQGIQRKNRVGVFKLAPDFNNDVGITAVVEPTNATLSDSEEITVTIRNFGMNTQTDFPVSYTVDGGETVTEPFTGSIPATSSQNFTFSTTADLGEINQTYEITASTHLANDEEEENDSFTTSVLHLFPIDVGVTSIDEPSNGLELGSELVTIIIENFGGETQSNIPVGYRLENNVMNTEVFPGPLAPRERAEYTFSQRANLSAFGRFMIYAETNLEGDGDRTNDGKTKSVGNLNCIPEGSDCSLGDGVFSFELGDIVNDNIPCTTGYIDFIDFSTDLDRAEPTFTVRVKTLFASEEDEQFSLWIDFNDNGVFDDKERLISNEILPTADAWHDFEFSLPANASLGQHLMRVRAGDVSFDGDINDPCSVMAYGTTHDYSVRIVDSTLDLEDFLLNDATLEIIDGGNGSYTAFLETTFDRTLRVTIYNLLGQKLLENQVHSTGQGYLFDFDMSFASTGVYLLRMGTRKVGVVKRFIVK